MKFSTTFVFSLLFLTVGGFYIYMKPPVDGPTVQVPVSMRLLPLQDGDQISWIGIQDLENKQALALKLENKLWKLESPVRYAADPLLAEGFVTALSMSVKARRLTPEKEWAEYGLENPVMKIGIKTQKDSKERILDFGSPSPIGEFIYAKWEGEHEYFLLDANLRKAFNQTIYALRNKQVFRISFDDISKIRLKTEDNEYEIVQRNGQWFWMSPFSLLGESVQKESMEETVALLKSLFIKEFLDNEKRKPEALGFSETGSMIQIFGKENQSETLHLGEEKATSDSFLAYLEGENVFFLIARDNVRLLFEALEARVQAVALTRPGVGDGPERDGLEIAAPVKK